ncbi:MAG: serine hydrolase domain-containing protein, partial [Pseudonocardiaceae bacterium]
YTLGTGMVPAEPGTVPIADALNTLGQPPPDEWMRRLGTLPLVHQPGQRWMYDTAADVIGVLIARATGRSFGDALRERICDPLGMTDTAFSVGGESIGRLTTAYERDNAATGEPVVEDSPDGQWSRPPAFESGGGGLVSTAEDYLAFATALLAGGTHHGERVLSRPAVTLMTSDHLTPAQKTVSGFWPGYFDTMGWGFGMSVRTHRTHLGPSVGSYGWPGFYGTAWYNDPAEHMTTILIMQRAHAGDQKPPLLGVRKSTIRVPKVPLIGQLSNRAFVAHVDHLLGVGSRPMAVRVRSGRTCACGCSPLSRRLLARAGSCRPG